MRFRIYHPDVSEISFWLNSYTPDIEEQVNRLGPTKVISSAFDWPHRFDEEHNWTDTLNSLWWPQGGDTFSSCIILSDETQVAAMRSLIAAQSPIFKTSAETAAVTFDFSGNAVFRATPPRTAIATVSSIALTSSPAGLTLGTATFNASTNIVSFDASAGSDGSTYVIRIALTLAEGGDAVVGYTSVQVDNSSEHIEAPRPYIVLQAMLAPQEDGRNAESYSAAGFTAESDAADMTELIAWKLYPLPPVTMTEPDATDLFPGLYLQALVDIRYFYRNTPLNALQHGSSSSRTVAIGSDFPLIRVDPRDDEPDWFPPVRGYPDDFFVPLSYDPIVGNGTHPEIDGHTSWGTAVDIQAKMNNLRVVCRDVRSNWNAIGGNSHDTFAGVIADLPDDPGYVASYHLDAISLAAVTGNLIAGGMTDSQIVRDLISTKLHVLFRVSKDDYYYSIVVQSLEKDPTQTSDLTEDPDGPTAAERTHVPKVFLGVESGTRTPTGSHRTDLVAAAKQWAILYYRWRRKQAFFKFPGIAPVMPNGHASLIRWDFASEKFETTYLAVEGVEGTDDGFCAPREPRIGRIDGEGDIADGLEGKYAWTEMEDTSIGGVFSVKANGVVGYVEGVNGAAANSNYAQDITGKTAVPVGITVQMIPGTPYIDGETGEIFDHWRFITPDLLQVVKLRLTGVVEDGYYEAVIRRWDATASQFVDHEVIWVVLLD